MNDIEQNTLQIRDIKSKAERLAVRIGDEFQRLKNNQQSSLIIITRTYYVDVLNGNDTTGVLGDITKPYKNIDTVLALLPLQLTGTATTNKDYYIELIEDGNYPINTIMPHTNIIFQSKYKANIDFSSNTNNALFTIASNGPSYKFYIPYGNLIFNTAINQYFERLWDVEILCNALTGSGAGNSLFYYCTSLRIKCIKTILLESLLSAFNPTAGVNSLSTYEAVETVINSTDIAVFSKITSSAEAIIKLGNVTGTGNILLSGLNGEVYVDDISTTGDTILSNNDSDTTIFFNNSKISGTTIKTTTWVLGSPLILSGRIDPSSPGIDNGTMATGNIILRNFWHDLKTGTFPLYRNNLTIINSTLLCDTIPFNNNQANTIDLYGANTIYSRTPTILGTAVASQTITFNDYGKLETNILTLGSDVILNKLYNNNISQFTNDVPYGLGNAPFLSELVPDTYLPSTLGNFELRGSFFTEAMTQNINSVNGILVEGHTINYATFISESKILLNLLTSATEGEYDVTLNNGITLVFANVLQVISGTVYAPTPSDWTLSNTLLDVSKGTEVNITVDTALHTGIWEHEFDYTKDFIVSFQAKRSPVAAASYITAIKDITFASLIRVSDSQMVFETAMRLDIAIKIRIRTDSLADAREYTYQSNVFPTVEEAFDDVSRVSIVFKYISGIMYFYYDNILLRTFTDVLTENLKLKLELKTFDITNIKYIDLDDITGSTVDQSKLISQFINDKGYLTDPTTAFTIYVDTINGDDVTGVVGDANKPYKTDTAAYAALPADNGTLWTIQYIDTGAIVRSMSALFPARAIRIKCNSSGGEFDFSAVTGDNKAPTYLELDFPRIDFKHAGVVASTMGASNAIFRLTCDHFTHSTGQIGFEGFYQGATGSSSPLSYIKCRDATISISEEIVGYNGDFNVSNILTLPSSGNFVGNGSDIINLDVNTIHKNDTGTYNIFAGNGTSGSLKISKITGTGSIVLQNNYTRKMTYDFNDLDVAATLTLFRLATGLDAGANVTVRGALKDTGIRLDLAGANDMQLNFDNFKGKTTSISDAISVNFFNSILFLTNELFDETAVGTIVFDGVNTFVMDTPSDLFINQATPLNVTINGKVQSNQIGWGTNITPVYTVIQEIIKQVKVSLTGAQINSIGTTPIQAIVAPGVGKFINVLSVVGKLTWGTVAFDNNDVDIELDTGPALYKISSLIVDVANNIKTGDKQASVDNDLLENKALHIAGTDSVAVGDGTVDLYITYEIITL